MDRFKVIIVGGSIAGLTLAIILERYGIDFVVYEKHADIAPQLGASLATLPHGARILDQLGIFSQVEAMSMPIEVGESFGPDGRSLGPPASTGGLMEEILGYKMCFLDRQQILQILHDHFQDKSKIHVNSEVLKIEELDGAVKVALKDGSVVHGDILVGADGVHSRIRDEIWRIADTESPSYNSKRMSQKITSEYKCIFGISKRPKTAKDNATFKCFHKGRSYLCASGRHGKMYFFAFFKNAEITTHRGIPRYTTKDAENLAAKYAQDPLFHGVTFGDLYDSRMSAVLVPLEEYVLEQCFYQRGMLIGDSFHKMNPLAGQGGNSAIESAAFLADLLKGMLDRNSRPDNDTIQDIFLEFQEERRYRTTLLMDATKKLQRMEVLDNAVLKFLKLQVIGKLGHEFLGPLMAAASTPGRTLKYLQPLGKRGIVLLDQEVRAKPHDRSAIATSLWSLLMLGSALLGLFSSRYSSTNSASDYFLYGAVNQHLTVVTLAVNGMWVVESYRPGLLLSPLFSATHFLVLAATCGWEVMVPIYFALHIYSSRQRPFYYPSPRAINPSAARCLPIAWVVTLIVHILAGSAIMGQTGQESLSNGKWPSTLIHLLLPVLVRFGRKYSGSETRSVGNLLFSTNDMKHLSRYFSVMFLITSVSHLVLVSKFLSASGMDTVSFASAPAKALMQLVSLSLATISWCLFVVWDLQRVNLTKVSLSRTFLLAILGSVSLGPGAVLAALWKWREPVLEKGRERQRALRGRAWF